MRWTYDSRDRSLYIYVRDDGEFWRTVEVVKASVMVDYADTGKILGIELLAPDQPWPIEEIATDFDLTPEERKTLEFLEVSPLWAYVEGMAPPALLAEENRRLAEENARLRRAVGIFRRLAADGVMKLKFGMSYAQAQDLYDQALRLEQPEAFTQSAE